MQKYVTTSSLDTPGVELLKHHCNANEVCAIVGLHCKN